MKSFAGLSAAAFVLAATVAANADDIVRVQQRTMIPWSSARDGEARTYAAVGLRLHFSLSFDAEKTVTPVLHVQSANGEDIEAAGTPGFGDVAEARFGIGELDPSNDSPEVVFTSYTGGAHCCTLVVVLSPSPQGWRKIELGPWDGGPVSEFPRDVDGDGVPEIVVADQNFAYAFAPYALGPRPPIVYQIRDGRAVDASSDPAYAKLYEADFARNKAGCTAHNNGACAAFVADAVRLDRRDQAWFYMLSHYNKADRWDWPQGCQVMLENGDCPQGSEIVFADFPEALKWFLEHNGYGNPS